MSISEVKTTNIKVNLFTHQAFYLVWMPLGMPYSKTYNLAQEAGLEVDDEFGIIEAGKLFGSGWIGVSVKNQKEGLKLTSLEGEFKYVDVNGSYKQLSGAYKQLMKNHPEAKEYYNIYYNSPKETKEEDLRTRILFR